MPKTQENYNNLEHQVDEDFLNRQGQNQRKGNFVMNSIAWGLDKAFRLVENYRADQNENQDNVESEKIQQPVENIPVYEQAISARKIRNHFDLMDEHDDIKEYFCEYLGVDKLSELPEENNVLKSNLIYEAILDGTIKTGNDHLRKYLGFSGFNNTSEFRTIKILSYKFEDCDDEDKTGLRAALRFYKKDREFLEPIYLKMGNGNIHNAKENLNKDFVKYHGDGKNLLGVFKELQIDYLIQYVNRELESLDENGNLRRSFLSEDEKEKKRSARKLNNLLKSKKEIKIRIDNLISNLEQINPNKKIKFGTFLGVYDNLGYEILDVFENCELYNFERRLRLLAESDGSKNTRGCLVSMCEEDGPGLIDANLLKEFELSIFFRTCNDFFKISDASDLIKSQTSGYIKIQKDLSEKVEDLQRDNGSGKNKEHRVQGSDLIVAKDPKFDLVLREDTVKARIKDIRIGILAQLDRDYARKRDLERSEQKTTEQFEAQNVAHKKSYRKLVGLGLASLLAIGILGKNVYSNLDYYKNFMSQKSAAIVASVGQLFGDTNTKIDEVEGKVAGVETQVTDVKTEVTNVKTEVNSVGSKVEDVEGMVTDVETKVSNVDSRIADVEIKVDETISVQAETINEQRDEISEKDDTIEVVTEQKEILEEEVQSEKKAKEQAEEVIIEETFRREEVEDKFDQTHIEIYDLKQRNKQLQFHMDSLLEKNKSGK